jgi:chromate transporter
MAPSTAAADQAPPPPPTGSLADLARVFLRISLLGFGGPNAHIALMLDEVVERRKWLTREHFLQLVAVTNLLPGPNSSEVAIHIGHVRHGVRGGLVAGLAFTLPTFVIVVGLSALYFRYGTLPAVDALFAGLNPFIVSIILVAGWRLGRAAVTDAGTVALALAGVLVVLFASGGEVLAMLAAGIVGWFLYGRRARAPGAGALLLVPALASEAGEQASQLAALFWTTLWTGSVLFGGGYMLVALIEPVVVERYAWLTSQQFLDGIALTQSVPGPIVMMVAFIGYAVAGVLGAAVATVGIYLPSFLAVFGAAPLLERWRAKDDVRAVLRGVNATCAGAILGAGLVLAVPAVPDVFAAALVIAGIAAQLAFDVRPIWLVAAGAAFGLVRVFL